MNQQVLKNAIEETLKHKKVFESDKNTTAYLFGIKNGDISCSNLKRILIPAIQYRSGPSLNKSECEAVINDFEEKYSDIRYLLNNGTCQEDLDKLVETVNSIYDIGPKIANVFLKDIIYQFKIGKQLIPFLYLPIDVHIKNIFVSKLQAIDREEMPKTSDKYSHFRNKPFQEELSNIHEPRIEFDMFWYIGARFCSNHLFCDICWIKEYCKKRAPYKL